MDKGDKFMIGWIVDRRHVGTPNLAIALDIGHRCRAHTPRAARRAMMRYALERHAANRGLYDDVVMGRIG